MKCPTCGYIGFEATDRCRNCGYEFPQAVAPAAPDLAISDGDPGGPLRELDMRRDAALPRPAPAPPRAAGERPDLARVLQNLDRVIGAPEPPADLPLFGDAQPDLPPMVTPSATPRRPLAVRRTTPDPARLKAKPRPRDEPGTLALDLPMPDRAATDTAVAPGHAASSAEIEAAPPVRRALAAAIDFAIIAGIDAVILSFTLRLCGLTFSDLGVLPAVPLAAFFGLMNGGYFAAFTAAGGQTIGKMALGLRVVDTSDGPVGPGSAVLRALGCLVSVASLGLGFLPALVGDGGRALEDRLADTHVVRVPAA